MANFEVIVRPVVFPNIRPQSQRSLPPGDDPEQGFAVIHGNGGKQISLTNSWSVSASTSNRTETKRQVDVARVYQKNDNGSVNKDNFVDLEVANKIWMKGPSGPAVRDTGILEPGFVGTKKTSINEASIDRYDPIREKDNIEIKRKNVIKRGGEETGE